MKRSEIVSVGHIELRSTEFKASVDYNSLPVLPTRNLVLFPGVVYPINLVRESSRRLAEYAEQNDIALAIVCQRDESVSNPSIADLHEFGVIAEVMKVIPLPDDSALAMVLVDREKIHIDGPGKPSDAPALCVTVTPVRDSRPRPTESLRVAIDTAASMLKSLAEQQPVQSSGIADLQNREKESNPTLLINSLCASAPVPVTARCKMLAENSVRTRLDILIKALGSQLETNRLRAEIEEGARRRLSQRQRNAILETQMEQIREELYGEGSETAILRQQLEQTAVSDRTREAIAREIGKLENLNPQSPDFQTQHSYLRTVLELPWGKRSEPQTDFTLAEAELNRSHSGLEKVKERVLDQLAMLIHSPRSHAPIICLVGPPGVGKTSLGHSIASALGRKFCRVSLGGLHDESEIRGHRRTYIGAMPGRIIDAVRRAGTINPVIMLDEIDKIGKDYKGDPAAALLEVLDPEQNFRFHDNYIDLDFDLSDVLFITTANTLATIDAPLLDRMEVIALSGYSTEEKLDIANNHLLPDLREKMGLEPDEAPVADTTVSAIINDYTSESGVRQLQKRLATLLRKYIRAKVSKTPFPLPVAPESLRTILGVETITRDRFGTDSQPGVVTGLAWTAAGGEILFIECVLTPGKGDSQLSLTGNLGDVMKESAAISHRYVRAHAREFGIDDETLRADIHIHVPEGAIPKDGPSAGITMTTAIISAMTRRPVRPDLAMTGEMTLRGKVLPVGGIKEKILAAKRAGIREIILCNENRRHIDEVKPHYLTGLQFHYVSSLAEVISLALQ